jgi:hypothetical protein
METITEQTDWSVIFINILTNIIAKLMLNNRINSLVRDHSLSLTMIVLIISTIGAFVRQKEQVGM